MKNRDYVYQYHPVEEQDRGANDEGYYYEYCHSCSRRTEHEDEMCCECNGYSQD
jgi:hypothetical protein